MDSLCANAANLQMVYRWHAAGQLRPHCAEKYALADAAKAMGRLEARQATGKVVLVMGAGSKL